MSWRKCKIKWVSHLRHFNFLTTTQQSEKLHWGVGCGDTHNENTNLSFHNGKSLSLGILKYYHLCKVWNCAIPLSLTIKKLVDILKISVCSWNTKQNFHGLLTSNVTADFLLYSLPYYQVSRAFQIVGFLNNYADLLNPTAGQEHWSVPWDF